MIKKILSFLMMVISVFALTSAFSVKAEEVSLENVEEMRGVWVSTVSNLDFKIKQNTTSEADIQKWKNYFLDILKTVERSETSGR